MALAQRIERMRDQLPAQALALVSGRHGERTEGKGLGGQLESATGERATWPTTSPWDSATSERVNAPASRSASTIRASVPLACGAVAKARVITRSMAAMSCGCSGRINMGRGGQRGCHPS